MRKASFVATETIWYDNVPIPDNVPDKDIVNYIKENIEDFEKYKSGDFQIYQDGIYQATIDREDGSEYIVTIDDVVNI